MYNEVRLDVDIDRKGYVTGFTRSSATLTRNISGQRG